MKTTCLLALIGESLAAKAASNSPSFIDAQIDLDPVSYMTQMGKLANLSNIKQLLSQIDEYPPKKIPNLTKFKPMKIDDLRRALEISYMPTCPEDKVMGLTCICDSEYSDIGFARNTTYESSALIGYDKKNKQLIVAYKYTSSIRNWLSNFDFLLGQLEGAPKGIQVHRGMMEIYSSIHDQVMHKANEVMKNKKPKGILVTGYSLGGSLAILSTHYWAQFKKKHNVPVFVMGFSPARIGNLDTKLYMEGLGIEINHYTNRNDIVPQIPPRILNYTHIGLEIHEQAATPVTSELVVCSQEYDEDPNCAWGESGFRISHHMMPFGHIPILPPYCGKSDERKGIPDYA
ncbi:hypothetical protein DSO57_1012641 [Entomophthora muscae]|uniref:Uncharacterized protein n=2 Tax=Entomophthora muscae TaxID=34485 RepID=A0ACC2S8C0_9FUNG|nr:hypothetical protein DSO57_1012641 [Entomophthora muscae]